MRRLFVVALVGLAFPASAAAHATLEHTSPRIGERVESAPRALSLRFDQAVTPTGTSIQVRTAGGRLVSRPAVGGRDPRALAAAVGRLPRGAYTVRWHVLSADGHVVSGVFTFGVRVAAPPPSEAYGSGGPTLADHLVRWAYLLALALLLGGLAFRLLVAPGAMPAAYERRFFWTVGVGVVATLEAGTLAFLLRAEDALQLPFARFLYGDLSPLANGTRFGLAFIAMTLGYAVVAALVFVAWLTDRRWPLVPALLLGLGLTSGLSLSGHSAADRGSSWLSVLADWVHLGAAAIWLGGLVQLAVCVWPAAPGVRREAFLRFSRLAGALVALIVGAGVYLSVLRLPAISDLWSEHYGRVLFVKLALVAVALSWGAVHHFVVRPLLDRGPAPGGLIRSLAGESAVGVAILLAAAVLVDSRPPAPPPPGPAEAAQSR
jgi:copper transport protein